VKGVADYHIHTKFCHHATGEMEEYVRVASEKGFTEIGFADHAPASNGYDPVHRMDLSRFPDYVERIQRLRDEFTHMNIRLGIETDFYPGFQPFLERFLQNFPIDYVVGSVHFIDGLSVFMRDGLDFSRERERQLVRRYFALLDGGVRSGLIDVVGHLDLVKWIFPEMREEIHVGCCNVLDTIAKEGIVLELNTSGARKLPGEVYPGPDLLRIVHSLGIPVCLGSDAHNPEEVGEGFENAMILLEEVGYRSKGGRVKGLSVFLPERQ
jgi:histidinol-phosphatase (PHP family)